jgi:hypothetical protein
MDAPDDVLDGLGIKLLPVGNPRHALEFRDMAFQSVITDVAFEPPIIAFSQSDQMVVDLSSQVDLRMQMPEPLAVVELKDHSTPRHLHALLGLYVPLDHFRVTAPTDEMNFKRVQTLGRRFFNHGNSSRNA